MSIRTLIEVNHDRIADLDQHVHILGRALGCGHMKVEINGLRILGQRHHSEPEFLVRVPEGYALVPIALTAENGAKAALMGEFSQPCVAAGEVSEVLVTWTNIKAIWKAGIKHFAEQSARDC